MKINPDFVVCFWRNEFKATQTSLWSDNKHRVNSNPVWTFGASRAKTETNASRYEGETAH